MSAGDAASSLVDGRQIGVHVAGEAAATGHLLAGSRDLAQSLGVRGHVGQDDEHVLLTLVGDVLGGRQGDTWRDDALDSGMKAMYEKRNGGHRWVQAYAPPKKKP